MVMVAAIQVSSDEENSDLSFSSVLLYHWKCLQALIALHDHLFDLEDSYSNFSNFAQQKKSENLALSKIKYRNAINTSAAKSYDIFNSLIAQLCTVQLKMKIQVLIVENFQTANRHMAAAKPQVMS